MNRIDLIQRLKHMRGWPQSREEFEEFWADPLVIVEYLEPTRLNFMREVLTFIPSQPCRLLDLGCGGGHFLAMIADKWGNGKGDLYGVDYSQSAVDLAKSLLPHGHFYRVLAHKTGLKNESFDLIVAMEILEHVINPEQVLEEAWRLLASGGKLIITVPNGEKDYWIGHTNFWSKEELRTFLQERDFPNPDIRQLNYGESDEFILTQIIKSHSTRRRLRNQRMEMLNGGNINKMLLIKSSPLDHFNSVIRKAREKFPQSVLFVLSTTPLNEKIKTEYDIKEIIRYKETRYDITTCNLPLLRYLQKQKFDLVAYTSLEKSMAIYSKSYLNVEILAFAIGGKNFGYYNYRGELVQFNLIRCYLKPSCPGDQGRFTYQQRFNRFEITPGSVVLDIGSGHYPFPHATILSDLYIGETQHRNDEFIRDHRPVIVFDVHHIPLKDKSVDFVYCSHVLEHVDDPKQACAEIMRVGKRGYIETPTFGKDMLFSWAAQTGHKWHLVAINNTLIFFEYTDRQAKGIQAKTWCDLISDPNYHPIQDAFHNNQDIFNVMFNWTGSFECVVYRLDQPLGSD